MRWERLFADLEGQLSAVERDAFEGEVADRTRRELADIHMTDRLAAGIGQPVLVTVLGAGDIAGSPVRVGREWVLLTSDAGHDVVVLTDSVLAVRGLSSYAVGASHRADARLSVGHVLLALARDRRPVTVHVADGSRVEGTIERVGADFVDIAEHPTGDLRPAGRSMRSRSVMFGGIAMFQPAG